MTRLMVLLILAIVGVLMLAPQWETEPTTPYNVIVGIRDDIITIEDRSSPGSPGIIFVNMRFNRPRDGTTLPPVTYPMQPGTQLEEFNLFMEPETFLVLYDALTAYKNTRWPPPGR